MFPRRKPKENAPRCRRSTRLRVSLRPGSTRKTPERDDAHAKRQKERLVGNIFPALGEVDINAVTMEHIDNALAVVIERGARETAQRIRSIIINSFEYADLMGFMENPVISTD